METISLDSSEYWNYCAPDGSFSLKPTNPWNPDWAFQIVLAFGSLSFTQAKVVDIVWDIVSSKDSPGLNQSLWSSTGLKL